MFVIFDLDGTIANIDHRTHFVRGGKRDWDSFFRACVNDIGVTHVIETFHAHARAGHKVRIWSARSDAVRAETEQWLSDMGIDPWYLQHMRAADDNTPDVDLKRYWLNQEPERPDLVYDDRQRVVDMWRAEGIPCFQVVANWEDSASERVVLFTGKGPLLTLMVGPSGAGKSTWAKIRHAPQEIISSDYLRAEYTESIEDQSRNDDVFLALRRIARARLQSGLPVTIDATNLRRKDRLACVSLAPYGSPIRYVVVDRPLESKLATRGWRPEELIRKHHDSMQSVLRDVLKGDGLSNVEVVDARWVDDLPKSTRSPVSINEFVAGLAA